MNSNFEVNPNEFPSDSLNSEDLRRLVNCTITLDQISKPNFFERLFKCGRAKSYKKFLKSYFMNSKRSF